MIGRDHVDELIRPDGYGVLVGRCQRRGLASSQRLGRTLDRDRRDAQLGLRRASGDADADDDARANQAKIGTGFRLTLLSLVTTRNRTARHWYCALSLPSLTFNLAMKFSNETSSGWPTDFRAAWYSV